MIAIDNFFVLKKKAGMIMRIKLVGHVKSQINEF